jgi:hypothetical protein
MITSPGVLARLEEDTAAILIAEEHRARKVLRFFGKRLIREIATILTKRPSGVMLRKELDALLQPKLAEFHQRNHIVDRIKKPDAA